MGFYEQGEAHLRATGAVSSMNYVMRVTASGLAGDTHLTYGWLVWNASRTGLVAEYGPELNPVSYLNVRQDVAEGDVVDVTVFRMRENGKFKEIKNFAEHHQPPNTGSFYYTQFWLFGWQVQLAIGSGLSMTDLFQEFEQRTVGSAF